MTDAFAYLLTRSAVNRVRSQVLRLRNPRYVAAFVAGGLYLWWFIFRPSAVPQQGGSLIGGSLAALAPLLLVVVLGGVWLFGGDRTALAFSPAEISFLLPAPVSRRGLLAFKLVRAQAAIVISSVIWVFILRRGSSSNSALLAALSFWVLFSTLAMHRLAAALVRASAAEHRGAAFRRHWLAIVLFGTVVLVLALEVIDSRAALRAASGLEGTLGAFASLLARPAARVVLAPFRAMLAPTLAGSAAEWVRAIPAALAILLLHAWWLFRTDTAFEEAAVEASARRAVQLERLRARRSAMPVAPTVSRGARTIPLAPTGWPALAIVWKNVLCLSRTVRIRTLVGPIAVALVAAFAFARQVGSPWANVALVATILAFTLLLFGGRTLRNDLRSDMLHLPLLKTLPVRGSDMVLAEIASGAVPMAVIQLSLVLIAFVALALEPRSPVSFDVRLGLMLAAPVAIVALNGAMFTILNGTAVLFPAWMRLGAAGGAGVEVMGTNLLATGGLLVMLALLLIAPVIAAAVGFVLLKSQVTLAIVAAGTVGGAVLAAECYGAVLGLGRAFERAEPSQVV